MSGLFAVAGAQIAEEVVFAKLGVVGKPVAKLSNEALSLFYRVIGRNVNLRLNPAPSSADLDFNLRQVGVSRPANTQAHHIVAGTSPRAQLAKDALDRHDININSPNNGVFLPGCGGSAAVGAIHCGSHTYAYMDEVNMRILAAEASGGKVAILNELGQIKIELLAGLQQLNRRGVQ